MASAPIDVGPGSQITDRRTVFGRLDIHLASIVTNRASATSTWFSGNFDADNFPDTIDTVAISGDAVFRRAG